MIETTLQWKALTTFSPNALASTICYCLNIHQGQKRDEMPEPKLLSLEDIAGNKKV